jgi:hypothetical protein
MSHSSSTSERIAAEAAEAARAAADEAAEPEAKFFLRQHAILLERIAASYRRLERQASSSSTRHRLGIAAPLLSVLPL